MSGNTRKLLVPLATMAVAAAVTVGSGATWTSTTTSTTSVTAGALSSSNDSDAKTLTIGNMKPGDVLTGSVTISNTGSVDAKLAMQETVTTASTFAKQVGPDGLSNTADDVSDLQLRIDRDGTVIYDGNFGGFAASGLTDITGSTKLLAADPTSTADTTTITFKVRLKADADTSSQSAVAGTSYSFVATPADGSPLSGVFN